MENSPRNPQPQPQSSQASPPQPVPPAQPAQPLQTPAASQMVAPAPGEKPPLSQKRHIKFFAVILCICAIIIAVFYYQSHQLPEFIRSMADTLVKNPNKAYQSVTVIQQDQERVDTKYIVQSVGRSETTYKRITQTAVSE